MSSGRARWGSPTGRRCWDVTTRREGPWRRRPRRREELWKRRGVEKSERRLSHPAWKSRKVRGIPTFPQLRRRLVKLLHRTYHVLQKADILTCYEQCGVNILSRLLRNVPILNSLEMSPFVLWCSRWN